MSYRLVARRLGLVDYQSVWRSMSTFTNSRESHTADELWLVQHPAVFTQGQAGKPEHVLNPREIPVVATDRGGQVTYHGPGQLVVYPLLDLRRLKLGVRDLVSIIENSVIEYLARFGVVACAKADAPGVYIDGKKIASLGLRVRKGCSFHGVSLNVKMDLEPFQRINPCGYDGLQMTQLADHADLSTTMFAQIETGYAQCLAKSLSLELDCSQAGPHKPDLKRHNELE